MKKYAFRRVFLILTALVCGLYMSAATNVEKGDSAYNKKEYHEALRYYSAALNDDGVSSNLYYNMGNTYYRLNDIGHAIVNYERALAYDPSNKDARANLEFVRGKLANAPEDDSSFLSNVHHNIIAFFTPDTWAVIALVIFIVCMSATALYMFTSDVRLRKVGFFGGIILLGVFFYALIVAYSSADAANCHDTAIVISPSTNLRSTPASSNSKTDKVVPVPEGTRLEIIDSLATPDDPNTRIWYEVKVNNSTRAWAAGADVERI